MAENTYLGGIEEELRESPTTHFCVNVYAEGLQEDLKEEMGLLEQHCQELGLLGTSYRIGEKTASFTIPRIKGQDILSLPPRGYRIEKGVSE